MIQEYCVLEKSAADPCGLWIADDDLHISVSYWVIHQILEIYMIIFHRILPIFIYRGFSFLVDQVDVYSLTLRTKVFPDRKSVV